MLLLVSSDKLDAKHFHSAKYFIDDVSTINDGGEFGRSICDIYPKEFRLKVKYQCDQGC